MDANAEIALLESQIADLQAQSDAVYADCWRWYRETIAPFRQRYNRLNRVGLHKAGRDKLESLWRKKQADIHAAMIGKIKSRSHAIWISKNLLWTRLLNLKFELKGTLEQVG